MFQNKTNKMQHAMYGFYFAAACLLIAMPSCKKTEEVVTDPPPVTMKDIDGNEYPTVKIGNQTWTTVNLKTTRYTDGVVIATDLDDATWTVSTTGACTSYGNTTENNVTYGKLYNWYAINTGKLVPTGWHVPSSAEWETLTTYLATDAGGKMKANSALWVIPSVGADNTSGFTGLPGGYRNNTGVYGSVGYGGFWWASTQRNTAQSSSFRLEHANTTAFISWANKTSGFAIRCIKD
jgi:uncharacterized protein (TIGR02145 family)